MKSVFFALMGLLCFVAKAQPVVTTLQGHSTIKGLDCSKDEVERLIAVESVGEPRFFKNFRVTGCQFSVKVALTTGNYNLTVSGLGLESKTVAFTVKEMGAPIEIPDIALQQPTNQLKEVVVTGIKKQYLKVEADKTIVSVKENPLLNSGSSLDAVKKVPGVITSPTGGLSLNGKGVRIYIDGAPSSLTGTDLLNYLATLPANAIEKIELIYAPGAAYDANTSGSIINIITTAKRMKGVNASFNINYNFNKYQKPSPQIMLNGKEKNLSWQTMLGYNYIDSENKTQSNQNFVTFNPAEQLVQRSFTVTTQRNFYFRTGTNYKLSKMSNLLLNYNLNLGNDRGVFDSSTNGSTIDYVNEGVSKTKLNNHEISLQYKTRLDTLGQTLDITAYTNLFDRNPITQSSGWDRIANQRQYNSGDQDFALKNYYLKADWTYPVKKWDASFSAGTKWNLNQITNNGKYNFNSTSPGIYGSFIGFDYRETNLAGYVEGRKKWKKWSFTGGIRYEDFQVNRQASQSSQNLQVDFRNRNFFPNLNVLYEINDAVRLGGTYSRKIAQPDYNTLDPNNSSNFDRYNSSQGNPLLNPTFFDNYEVKLTALDFIQLGGNYSVAKDNNRFLMTAAPNSLISNQTFAQFDRIKTLSFFASFPVPLDYIFKGKAEFQKRMNNIDQMNYIFFNISYIKTTVDGYTFSFDNKPIMNYAAQSQIILPWNIKQTMVYFILPEGNWEIYRVTKPIQQFDVSFQKEFMNNNLKVGVHAFDLFNQNEINGIISSTNLESGFYQKQDSRTFRLSLTYNFGNVRLQKDNTDIQVDKAKQGGGGMMK
ncbi:MAG: hypothetical protein CFE24_11625 [Flavobacterium sp. BFFFF2]|nr:MAG: hypothetical protein CFE24_11625 [Flavobacterium sp. BFFFF2]